MRYTLRDPWQISSRLMPAVTVGGAWLSIEPGPRNREGRTQYDIWIDLPDGGEYHVTDLRSGCGGGDVREGMLSLLSFLYAAAESYPDGENADLFPPAVVAWADSCADDLTMLQLEIDESPETIQEG